MIWDGTVEEIEDWLDKIFKKHGNDHSDDSGVDIIIDEIEE